MSMHQIRDYSLRHPCLRGMRGSLFEVSTSVMQHLTGQTSRTWGRSRRLESVGAFAIRHAGEALPVWEWERLPNSRVN
jgi:hypothetical protein